MNHHASLHDIAAMYGKVADSHAAMIQHNRRLGRLLDVEHHTLRELRARELAHHYSMMATRHRAGDDTPTEIDEQTIRERIHGDG